MSEKRLLGWEPSETHAHEYDADGRMVRTTVSRESEWDDFERAKMLALREWRDSLCACGLPESVADEDPDLQQTVRVCPVCAGLAAQARIQQADDEKVLLKLGEKPEPSAPRPMDGRYFGLMPKAQAQAGSMEDENPQK